MIKSYVLAWQGDVNTRGEINNGTGWRRCQIIKKSVLLYIYLHII